MGEIYTLLEPFANLEIEKKVGCPRGVYVRRSLYLSEWIKKHILTLNIFNLKSRQYEMEAIPFF